MKITKNTIIIGLIILNIAVVTFFLLMKPKHPVPPKGPKEIIIEKLALTQDQRIEFDELVIEHRKGMKKLHEDIRATKKTTYKRVLTTPEEEDSLLTNLSKKLIAIDKHNIKHLRKVKKILNKEQMPAFHKLMDNIDRVFQPRPPKPRQEGPKRPPRPHRPPHNN